MRRARLDEWSGAAPVQPGQRTIGRRRRESKFFATIVTTERRLHNDARLSSLVDVLRTATPDHTATLRPINNCLSTDESFDKIFRRLNYKHRTIAERTRARAQINR